MPLGINCVPKFSLVLIHFRKYVDVIYNTSSICNELYLIKSLFLNEINFILENRQMT